MCSLPVICAQSAANEVCESEPRLFLCVLKIEKHGPHQRKKPLFPLSFERKVGEDEKVQALKQRFHSARRTLGLHRNKDLLFALLEMLESQ